MLLCSFLFVLTVGSNQLSVMSHQWHSQFTYYLAVSECNLDKVIMRLALQVALAEYFGI